MNNKVEEDDDALQSHRTRRKKKREKKIIMKLDRDQTANVLHQDQNIINPSEV